MERLYLSTALLLPLPSYAQTTFYNDQYGMPVGSATRSGNTTYFNDAYGMPQGTATQSGNTTFFNNQYGLPVGSATALLPPPTALAPLPSLPNIPLPQPLIRLPLFQE